ncbi:hypothetical protein Tco_1358749 [Tanacetum coccineum]
MEAEAEANLKNVVGIVSSRCGSTLRDISTIMVVVYGQPITGPLILLDVVVLAKQVWCNYLNNDLKKRIVVFAGGFNRNTKLGSKEILLLSYVLAVLTLAAVLPNLDMEMDERAQVLTTNVWTERLQSSQEWTEVLVDHYCCYYENDLCSEERNL